MNKFKKILSLILTLLMTFSCFGILANAAGENNLSFYYNEMEEYFVVSSCNKYAYGEINIPAAYYQSGVGTKPVGEISYGAFKDAETITKVTIPSSVKKVGDSAFENCALLKEVVFENADCTIGIAAFRYCSSLDSITLPSSLKAIPIEAFAACFSLKSIEIPSTVTVIGKEAFRKCSALKMVTVPASVTSIDINAFLGCSLVENYVVASGNKKYKAVDGILFDIKGETLIQYPNGKNATQYSVPSGVKTIADSAFGSNTKLTKITLPEGVKTISEYAFNLCSALSEINLPSTVTEIGAQAFGGCKNLKEITLPAGLESYSGAFYNSGLETVILTDGIDIIDEKAFEKCASLKSVTIPSSLSDIRMGAFDGCTSLETLELRASVTSIDKNAFLNCPKLVIRLDESSLVHKMAEDNGWKYEFIDGPVENDIASIEIKTLPSKLTYTAGEKINTSGMVLTVTYENGAHTFVTSGFELDTQYATGTGKKTVNVTYKGKSTSFDITVTTPVEKTIVGMSIGNLPDKTAYYYKESLSTSGMKLIVEYDDGSTETVTSGYTLSETTFKTVGTHKITVTYKGFTDDFSVNVSYAWWQLIIMYFLLGFLWY